ncbi:hypothetical protein JDM601_0486 [Mycolicibacter sinensis]|uniref:Uncharacterized protein n=1 Tax=Mycolicibacter sinensis (strain JDM601) TaxID=875328 RepID=F5Z1I5_MYCSD|nr:hypothetical protein JDM601_0486 [Mycolicibacter sinensis]
MHQLCQARDTGKSQLMILLMIVRGRHGCVLSPADHNTHRALRKRVAALATH